MKLSAAASEGDPASPLHPLNHGFEWRGASGPLHRLTPEQKRVFDEDGGFVLENAFDAEAVARVRAEIDPFEDATESFLRTRPDGRVFIARAGEITFTTHLVKRSDVLRDFCSHPLLRDLCHDLIGPDVRLYWDQAVYKKPAADREFPWHQDNGYTFVEPQQYLTCWIALTDATVENGCPWIVPGLHRRGTLQHRITDLGWCCLDDPPGARPLPVPAGGIAVFSSLTPHRTGPNRTGDVRKAYIVQFAPDGAEALQPEAGGPVRRVAQDAPDRQFPVLVGGRAPEA